MMSRRRMVDRAALVLLSMWVCFAASAQAVDPAYEANGNLRLPKGYETWVFVGSNLGLEYRSDLPTNTTLEAARGEVQMFHNVLIEPSAYAAFVKTGDFPDPTMLIMEVYLAEGKEASDVLGQGLFNGPRRSVEAAVKDSERPTRPDSKEIWAYYRFVPLDAAGTPAPSAQAQADSDCFACHKAHASHDNVWTQFYPVLRQRLGQ